MESGREHVEWTTYSAWLRADTWRQLAFRHKALASVALLGGGTALGQGLTVIVTPIITRLYNPSDLGLAGILIAFVGFASVGVGLCYELAIVSARNQREADSILMAALLFCIPTSIVAGVLMLVMIRRNILSFEMLPTWSVPLAVLGLIFIGVFTSLRYWFIRKADFSSVGSALIAQGAGRATVSVALGFGHAGWVGLLLAELSGRALGIGRMMREVGPHLVKILVPLDLGFYGHTLRRNWKFPVIVLPSSLIDSMSTALPVTVISWLFGAAAAGEFVLVNRVARLPAGLIAASVADVFHSHISRVFMGDPAQVRPTLWRAAKKLGLISGAIYLPLAVLGPFAFGVIFGRSWSNAGIIMTILSPAMFVSTIVSPLSRALLVGDFFQWKFLSDAVRLTIPMAGLLGMHHLGYDLLPGLFAFSALDTLTSLFYFGVIWKCS